MHHASQWTGRRRWHSRHGHRGHVRWTDGIGIWRDHRVTMSRIFTRPFVCRFDDNRGRRADAAAVGDLVGQRRRAWCVGNRHGQHIRRRRDRRHAGHCWHGRHGSWQTIRGTACDRERRSGIVLQQTRSRSRDRATVRRAIRPIVMCDGWVSHRRCRGRRRNAWIGTRHAQ